VIAPEGRLPVLSLAVGAAVLWHAAGAIASAPLVALLAATLWIYFEPLRVVPPSPLGIVSPVDGHVRSVAPGLDPWLNREALIMSIVPRRFGIGALRSPTEGKVMDFWADAPGACGGSYAIWIQTDEGDDVAMCVRTRRRALFRCDVAPGERIGQGQRNGFVYFARRVDVYVPASARACIADGGAVLGATDVIAKLVREAPAAGHSGKVAQPTV